MKGKTGALSICSTRGKCKWSHDMDKSNLLPYCETTTARDSGGHDKCKAYKKKKIGTSADDDDCTSTDCNKRRCLSMSGCEFTPSRRAGCMLSGRTL